MKIATIFSDGSSRGNPGPGGWGAIVSFNGEIIEIGGREDKTTNNRMELTAVIVSLSGLLDRFCDGIVVYTDSSYVVNGSTKWIHGWKKNGWVKKEGGEVLNKDLWERMDFVLEKLNVEWNLVKGHVGVAGNERVDEIATAFADDKYIELYSGSESQYGINLKSITPLAMASNKKDRTKIKAYSYLSLVNGELIKHKTWAECESRVKGIKGAKYRKSISPEDELDIIEEWGVK